MSKRSLFAAAILFVLAIGVLPFSNLAMAQVSPHVTQALDHAKEAVKHGNMGHAEVATKGAAEAVRHLEMIE